MRRRGWAEPHAANANDQIRRCSFTEFWNYTSFLLFLFFLLPHRESLISPRPHKSCITNYFPVVCANLRNCWSCLMLLLLSFKAMYLQCIKFSWDFATVTFFSESHKVAGCCFCTSVLCNSHSSSAFTTHHQFRKWALLQAQLFNTVFIMKLKTLWIDLRLRARFTCYVIHVTGWKLEMHLFLWNKFCIISYTQDILHVHSTYKKCTL